MSRRMDREGVHRMEPQGIQNRRFWADPRCVENERGWVQPFANWQGWDEWNKAAYAYRRMMILRRHMSAYERADTIRVIRYEIAASRTCDRPRLP
jgi:hypothetical protein